MGLYFEIQCTECDYHETLYEGECGLEHLDAMRIKKEFESGEGDPFYRTVFEHFRSTVSKEDSIGNTFLYEEVEPGSEKWEEHRLLYGEPYIRLIPTIYECSYCDRFFNHNRMSIVCKKGIFRENCVECPTCKSRNTYSKSAEVFFEDEALISCLVKLTILMIMILIRLLQLRFVKIRPETLLLWRVHL